MRLRRGPFLPFFGKACRSAAAVLFAIFFLTSGRVQAEPFTGALVVGQNADGRLELFKIDADGELRHRWQKPSNGDWSSWSSLGGSFVPGLTVARVADGKLEVFAVDKYTHALKCIRQTAPNSHDWSSWANLGGAVRAPVSVGQNLDGRLEVFAVNIESNSVSHIWQTDLPDGWSGWMNLGGTLEPGLVVGRNKDGRLELFGVDARDGALMHCWQSLPNGINDWLGWTRLGGKILPGLAVEPNEEGDLEVFAVKQGGGVQHLHQISAGQEPGWSAWTDLGGDILPGIAAGQNADGRLEIFAVRKSDRALVCASQTKPGHGGEWSGWTSLGGAVQSSPAVARNQDGTLQVFVASATNNAAISYRRQILANSDWLDWSDMEHSTPQFSARTWQTDDGLPNNHVESIAQTPDGYLWVGTRGGLARFDGVHFTVFNLRNTPVMLDPTITSLCVDREGVLWIGTWDGLLSYQKGSFSRLAKTNGLPGNGVSSVCEGRDGSLWIGTTRGLCQMKVGRFTTYTHQQGLVSDVIRTLCMDSDENLWITTDNGLSCLKDGHFKNYSTANGLPENSLHGLAMDKLGRLWIGTDRGLACYNRDKFYTYGLQQGLSDNVVPDVCEDRQGNLWVGTFSGLSRLHEGRFIDEFDSEGNPYDKINVIFEDHEGHVWTGSREGLTRLAPRRFFALTRHQGLTHNNVMSVMEDRAGSLWVATWGGGLDQLKEDRITAYTTANGLSSDLILCICEGHDGSIWMGADYQGGLTRLKDGVLTHYGPQDGLINSSLRVLHEDRAGNLWVGTSKGLSCLRDGKFTNYTAGENHLAGDIIRSIFQDHEGTLWFGTESGLSRWDHGKFVNYGTKDGLPDAAIMYFYEDKENTLWIATLGGLMRYKDGRFKTYTAEQGLVTDFILAVLEDDNGCLWMSSNKGIFRVRKKDLQALDEGRLKVVTSLGYGKADGLESALFNAVAQPAAWKARDGRLWFPTTRGVIAVAPDVKVSERSSPVYITQLIADKQPLLSDASTTQSGAHGILAASSAVQVPPGRGELEFQFTCINFEAPERSRFKYRLRNVDSEWIDSETRRVAHYNNIYPGDYRFQVIACNADGVWNEQPAELAIVVLPHIWQTWWFIGLCILAAIGLVSGVARYATRRRLQRALDLLEQQHAIERERMRIAQDIHDDLGSSLTRIMMYGERAQEDLARRGDVRPHLDKMVASSRATVQSLDEIVWAVNPENDSLNSLIEYLGQYADQFFENTNVACRFEMPVDLPAMPLAAEVRHDLFLVVKEALNNALKHSRATQVHLKVSTTAETVEIVIHDNGCGIESREPAGGGRKSHGLENMRNRVEALGGVLRITSLPGKGTELRFTAHLNPKRGGSVNGHS